MSHLTLIIPVYLNHPLHQEFTTETLNSIKTSHDYQVLIIVNFAHPSYLAFLKELPSAYPQHHLTIITNPFGNQLASAWNLGINHAFFNAELPPTSYTHPPQTSSIPQNIASDFCLILNNDIVLHPQAIDHLVEFQQAHPEFLLVSGVEHANLRTLHTASTDGSFALHPHFSFFSVSPSTIQHIGWFDHNLSVAYFEDNDYHIRILLSGHQAAATTTALFYHYGSRTSQVDDKLRLTLKPHYQHNRAYIQEKWGLDIHGQGFSPPDTILPHLYAHPYNDPTMSYRQWRSISQSHQL